MARERVGGVLQRGGRFVLSPFGGRVALGGVAGVGGQPAGQGWDDIVAGDPADDLVAVGGEDGEAVWAVEDQLAQGLFEGFVARKDLGSRSSTSLPRRPESVGVGGVVWARRGPSWSWWARPRRSQRGAARVGGRVAWCRPP